MIQLYLDQEVEASKCTQHSQCHDLIVCGTQGLRRAPERWRDSLNIGYGLGDSSQEFIWSTSAVSWLVATTKTIGGCLYECSKGGLLQCNDR
jgi:hypothetical protein